MVRKRERVSQLHSPTKVMLLPENKVKVLEDFGDCNGCRGGPAAAHGLGGTLQPRCCALLIASL